MISYHKVVVCCGSQGLLDVEPASTGVDIKVLSGKRGPSVKDIHQTVGQGIVGSLKSKSKT